MNRKNWILLIVGLALIGGGAGVLARLQEHLTLSPPGVKTHPIPGSANLQVELPERVLDYTAAQGHQLRSGFLYGSRPFFHSNERGADGDGPDEYAQAAVLFGRPGLPY